MTEQRTHNDNSRPEGNAPGSGIDLGAIFNSLFAAASRRRLVLRHDGETVLRLPLTIAMAVALLLVWQSPLLFVGAIALVFFLHIRVSMEYRPPQQDRPAGPGS